MEALPLLGGAPGPPACCIAVVACAGGAIAATEALPEHKRKSHIGWLWVAAPAVSTLNEVVRECGVGGFGVYLVVRGVSDGGGSGDGCGRWGRNERERKQKYNELDGSDNLK